jgi:hypothetical protein
MSQTTRDHYGYCRMLLYTTTISLEMPLSFHHNPFKIFKHMGPLLSVQCNSSASLHLITFFPLGKNYKLYNHSELEQN